MKRFLLLAATVMGVALLSGAPATSDPSKKVAIVAAFEPILFGQRVGFGSFVAGNLAGSAGPAPASQAIAAVAEAISLKLGNEGWYAEATGFDINGAILRAAKPLLNRDASLIEGRSAGIIGDMPPLGIRLSADELEVRKMRLAAMGRELGTDLIVILHSAVAADWMQQSGRSVYGLGHFCSHYEGIYCVLTASIYDCKTGKFSKAPVITYARAPLGISWHKTWAEYPADEQRALLHELDFVLSEAVRFELHKLGMAKGSVKALPDCYRFNGAERPLPFVDNSDDLVMPRWLSVDQVRAAARIAFSRYDWTIAEDAGKRISGSHKKGSAETVSTITVENGKILLRSEGFRLKDDGTRKESADYNTRWHSNLKVEFVTQLMKAEGQAPAE